MGTSQGAPGPQQQGLAAYLEGLVQAAGHADRVVPLKNYCTGLLLPGQRKSVEPMAAGLALDNYLGMRVRTLAGLKTLLGFGPRILKAGVARPEGLLHFETNIIFGLFPLHLGMRWYWKDFESMERWADSEPHRLWWQGFLRSSGGTGAGVTAPAYS